MYVCVPFGDHAIIKVTHCGWQDTKILKTKFILVWSLFSLYLLADVGGAKRNKAKKSPDEKKDEESNEGEDDHDDDSDLEKAGARKRSAFRSKLLDAKISDSDSDIEIKKRKTG